MEEEVGIPEPTLRGREAAPSPGGSDQCPEMVERVAAALEEVYLSATEKNPDDWPRYARAAIAALQDPTP